MTRLQQEGERLIYAIEMTRVETVIALYEKGVIESGEGTVRDDIRRALVNDIGMDWGKADYWLDFFAVR